MEGSAKDIAKWLEEYIGDIDPSSKRGRKRRAILDVATKMFAELGYRRTSMDEIASAVGVAKGTLYLYFPKKIDLLIACAAREKLEWVPEMLEIFTGDAPPAERLKRWIRAMLLMPRRSPLISRLLDDAEMAAMLADYPQELLQDGNDKLPKMLQPMLDAIAGEHRWNELELRDRVHVIRAIAHLGPALRHEELRPGMSAERFAAIFADLIVDGIRPRGPKQPEQPEQPEQGDTP